MWERDKKILLMEIALCFLTIINLSVKIFLNNGKNSAIFLIIQIILTILLFIVYFIGKKKNNNK
jgi:hypothetical protein